ncbi:MAG: threonine dehydrogenase [Planctomycetota bacterium]|nr:MAG: threonine dehydrogenase [Planctomycetota bacterium]
MADIRIFRALEYCSDTSFLKTEFRLSGSLESGWRVERNGQTWLELGPGYRLLRSRRCGVCSTDLDRHFLPFRLPQVTGHELVATDEQGRHFVVEINATRASRGIDEDNIWRRAGLDTHDPERLVLGIHDLPGGFSPWVLVPEHATLELPPGLSEETAVLTEPFAAVLHGIHMLQLRAGERVAVLGPRRLGLLAIAALAGVRRGSGVAFEIEAWSRHEELGRLACELGADRARLVTPEGDALTSGEGADLVLDTTASPKGLETALSLARREVHLKSTHGRPAAGLAQSTALVVDEIRLCRLDQFVDFSSLKTPLAGLRDRPLLAWMSKQPLPPELAQSCEVEVGEDALELRQRYRAKAGDQRLPRADAVVVDDLAAADRVIRPSEEDEEALVRPRGSIFLLPNSKDPAPLARAIAERGITLSSSRCGDFAAALGLLATDPMLRDLGRRFVTHSFPAQELRQAFDTARQPDCIKAVVIHTDSEPEYASEA